ncbi:MAG TPA: hypothetical protein VFL61_01895 [Gaiellaceae bacterium]|nr:hypothetical protein [Gaiellaceae bacterium]
MTTSGARTRVSPLADAAVLAMLAYTRSTMRAEMIGGEGFRFQRGTLVLFSHRRFEDVPLLASSLYLRARAWRSRDSLPHVAAREDIFHPGFLAGFRAGTPLWLRRILYPVSLASWLPRFRAHPVSSATTLKLGEALSLLPAETPLESVLAPRVLALLEARARELGLRPPLRPGDVLRAEFADLLLAILERDELVGPAAAPVWEQKAGASLVALRELVELVRAGEPLLLSPEGRVSPDGAIGPLDRAVGLLLRRGRPETLLHLGVAYDPLTRGRPWAYVAFGSPLATPEADAEAVVLSELRRLTPLTCGQVVAARLARACADGRGSLSEGEVMNLLAAEVADARVVDRPVPAALASTDERRRRVAGCLSALERRGLIRRRGASFAIDSDRVADDPELRYLVREFESARDLLPDGRPGSERGIAIR